MLTLHKPRPLDTYMCVNQAHSKTSEACVGSGKQSIHTPECRYGLRRLKRCNLPDMLDPFALPTTTHQQTQRAQHCAPRSAMQGRKTMVSGNPCPVGVRHRLASNWGLPCSRCGPLRWLGWRGSCTCAHNSRLPCKTHPSLISRLNM